MKTKWDYTELAEAYLKRPDYSASAIDEMLSAAAIIEGGKVCDVGAGVGHLTIMLAGKGLVVDAVEPNDAMRGLGMERTKDLNRVSWSVGVGEDTGRPQGAYDLVAFGSSFNVTDRPKALLESHRLLKPGAWFACMWNHRRLEDPIQAGIESAIARAIPAYDYGVRRADQAETINASGLFGPARRIEGGVRHAMTVDDCVEAWRSHATLQRQAGDKFDDIVAEIEKFLLSTGKSDIEIPYVTRLWMAQKRD